MMSNKRITNIALLLLTFQCILPSILWAQDVVINLSIEEISESPGSTAPFLKIEYINNSSKNYYFPAIASLDNIKPRYSTGFSSVISVKTKDLIDFCRDKLYGDKVFQGEDYYLLLDFLQTKDTVWDLLSEESFEGYDKEYVEDEINYYLYVWTRYGLEIIDTDNDTGVFPKSIFKHNKRIKKSPSFVFLKKHESVIQSISLCGLDNTGIVLHILLSSTNVPQSVRIGYGNNDTYPLPAKIGRFYLFTGIIESNSVSYIFVGE